MAEQETPGFYIFTETMNKLTKLPSSADLRNLGGKKKHNKHKKAWWKKKVAT